VANANLTSAKKAKKDEFYTQWVDIEREVNAYLEYDPDVFRGKVVLLPCDDPEWSNFTKFFALHFVEYGLKKLISTSYAPNSNSDGAYYMPTLLELDDPQFDAVKTRANGRLFTLENKDINADGVVNIEDLQWRYLECNGDFRSQELISLRDESDIIITNPPFSLFREFLGWVSEAEKRLLIIGNMNATTYKEVFPLIKVNRLWLGPTITSGDREFRVPDSYPLEGAGTRTDPDGNRFIRIKGVRWFTNLENGRRHEPLQLMTMADNIQYSKHKEVRGAGYAHYDNYDAIEVPFTDAIPSDYDGVMGVPISFLDKYSPDQFEIVGTLESNDPGNDCRTRSYTSKECRAAYLSRFGKPGVYDLNAAGVVNGIKVFKRILIRRKTAQ